MVKLKIEEMKSRAKQIDILYKKYQGTFKSYLEMTNFKEPVLELIRNDGTIEFFEDASKGKFTFMHSNGTMKYLILDSRYLLTMPYGRKSVRKYICHEDMLTPYLEKPVLTAEIFRDEIDKVNKDLESYKSAKYKNQGLMIKDIAKGLAWIIGIAGAVIILGGMFGAHFPWEKTAQVVPQVITPTILNP